MNRLSLRRNQLTFKNGGKLPIILEEIIEYTMVTKYEVQKYNISTYMYNVHVQC